MSDFDKEAEREKLREKFERDEKKRAATQQMSELLLKGATMTNKHCNNCGNPIFRYQGQEFCPTCENAQVNQAAAQEAASAADAEANGNESGEAQTTTAAGDAETAPIEASTETDASADRAVDVEPTSPTTDGQSPQSTEPNRARSPATRPNDVRSTAAPDAPVSPSAGTESGDEQIGDDLDEARASLRRTVLRYSRAAESTDDPRRAKELLGAAREAAETLAALRR